MVIRALIAACAAAAVLGAAEDDRLVLKNGRVLTGEFLSADAEVVRFAIGSSIQEMPWRTISRVDRPSATRPEPVRPAVVAAPVTTVVTTTVVERPVYIDRPVYVEQPRYVQPCAPAPYVTSGWSLGYTVGSWNGHRRSGWGLGWSYGISSAPGWCAPRPWCR